MILFVLIFSLENGLLIICLKNSTVEAVKDAKLPGYCLCTNPDLFPTVVFCNVLLYWFELHME